MKEIRVLFDVSILAHAVGGINRYNLELLSALRKVSGEFGLRVTTLDVPATHPGSPSPLQADIKLPDPAYMKIPLLRRRSLGGRMELLTRASRIRRLGTRCSVFHHCGVQPEYPPGSTSVITVHDLSGVKHPEWHTADTVAYSRVETRMLEDGAYAVTNSRWTMESLQEELELPHERVRCIGGAAGSIFSPGNASSGIMDEYGIEPGKYFLHVGNFVPRKNIPMLCRIFNDPDSGIQHPLLLVGKGEWGGISTEPSNSVKVFRSVPDDHMVHLYRGARALLIPSLYEGLGFPVLEAYACGTGVISSGAAALTETVSEWGVILDPEDEQAWRREIATADKEAGMDRLRRMAGEAVKTSWLDVARKLCTFYREVAGE